MWTYCKKTDISLAFTEKNRNFPLQSMNETGEVVFKNWLMKTRLKLKNLYALLFQSQPVGRTPRPNLASGPYVLHISSRLIVYLYWLPVHALSCYLDWGFIVT